MRTGPNHDDNQQGITSLRGMHPAGMAAEASQTRNRRNRADRSARSDADARRVEDARAVMARPDYRHFSHTAVCTQFVGIRPDSRQPTGISDDLHDDDRRGQRERRLRAFRAVAGPRLMAATVMVREMVALR